MKKETLKKQIETALFMAIVCVATLAVHIPIAVTGGYINLGDCFVIVSVWTLGPVYGTLAAGIGSALADVFLGYMMYAPATLVIKSVMALAAYFTVKLMLGKVNITVSRIIGAVIAEILMVLGYFGYESLLLGQGLPAAAGIPSNAIQGAAGLVASVLLISVMKQIKFFRDDILS